MLKLLGNTHLWKIRLRPFTGRHGEYLAKRHLLKKKYKIINLNWRLKWGELDIVAQDGDELVFVEVKSRLATHYSDFNAADAVDFRKINKIKKLADIYLDRKERWIKRNGILRIRYDVIGVTIHSILKYEIEHRIDAFD